MFLLISVNWPSLVTYWVVVQKMYSKIYLVSYNNTHRDITDSVNYKMVKNTKIWISWERNRIFLRNKKKILNLCLRWHILRSYCFVVEVTFKGNITSNYKRIIILPLVWKLLTGVLANEIYNYLESKMLLPEEQKRCRRTAKGQEVYHLLRKWYSVMYKQGRSTRTSHRLIISKHMISFLTLG